MPRSLAAWIDITILLCGTLILSISLFCYNNYVGSIALLVWLCMVIFSWDRCRHRSKAFDSYSQNMLSAIDFISKSAFDQMPQIVIAVNKEGIIRWHNQELQKHINVTPELNMSMDILWPEFDITTIWGNSGNMFFDHEDTHYHVYYCPLSTEKDPYSLMVLYVEDVTEFLNLKQRHEDSRIVLACAQIDNYDEVMKGITEAERSTLSYETNRLIDEWAVQMQASLRRISSDQYIIMMDYKDLQQARESKFDIIDKVHSLVNSRRMPVTISIGVASSENYTINELDMKAQEELDMALSRGGDQVALYIDGKTEFYGGKAQAIEKNTRVKARVMTQTLIEHMEKSDEIFVMGHANEDFDALGAAVGVARIAKAMKKPVHIVISETHASIEKLLDLLRANEYYSSILITADDLINITAQNPLIIIVDTHISNLVADPNLLERIDNVIVIDHHRRSENYIRNTLLFYSEPSSSSTSELVTEMIQYYPRDIILSQLESTALYAGILVDTKNFVVQTGARTFDASSYLRRSGLDTVMVRQLFKTDYDTDVAKAKAKAASTLHPNGLITTTCPDCIPNIQVIAAQVADSMLHLEKIRASIVVFQLTPETVGISARSTGEINVQVIMEHFGGGGHQNVAGAQIKNRPLETVYEEVIAFSNKFIEEIDNNESNTATGY